MSRRTPATSMLERAGAAFTVHEYAYDAAAAAKGMQAADALGVTAGEVFKTLMVLIDGRPACAMLAADRTLALKQVAAAFGGKSAAMMAPDHAERLTGYHVGGISPFGQRKQVPAVLDAAAERLQLIFLNGGQRGLQVRLAPGEVVRVLGCRVAPIAA